MSTTAEQLHLLRQRPRRRPGVVALNCVAALLLVYFVMGAALTPGFDWRVVGMYLLEPRILQGAVVSVVMTIVAMALSVVLGILVAVMRMSATILSVIARAYIWVFRAVPMLVQLLFWYNLAALFPDLGLGLPGLPPVLSVDTNDVISPLTAALVGLTLHETAYLAEIFRSGFLAVPRGQHEAAAALGLSPARTFIRVTLPQAFRIILPSLGNQVISLLKATSLVSVIALSDLLYSVQLIYADNYRTIPLLIVACIWYMVITGVLSVVQDLIERRLGDRRHRPAQASEVSEA